MATVSALSRTSSAVASASVADVVRHDDSRLSDSRTPTTHSHLVASPPYTLTYAASVTPDATLGNNIKITATGALTINEPTGGVDGQVLVIEILASGANRVVTINAAIELTTGQATTYTIVSGRVAYIALRFSALAGNLWVCTSMTQEL